MSATQYPLRNRLAQVVAEAVPPPGESPLSSPGTPNHESGVVTVHPDLVSSSTLETSGAAVVHPKQGSTSPAGMTHRLYSDVVASRPPSAASQRSNTQASESVMALDTSNRFHFNDNSILLSSTQVITEEPPDEEEHYQHWTLNESKRARRRRSFLSYETGMMHASRGSNLTSEQEAAVHAAERNLTGQERAKIDHHYKNVHINSNENDSSRDEGPSKGKGVDPHNWGVLEFEPFELNMNAQWEAMRAWNQVRDRDLANKESKPDDEEKAIPHQKNTKYKPQIKSVSDDNTPKVSAPAAARKKTPVSKLMPMSDTLMDRVTTTVKGHRRPNRLSRATQFGHSASVANCTWKLSRSSYEPH